MDILFAVSELAPVAKVGGLADVAAALAKALRLVGHKVTIALPRYPSLEAAGVLAARRLTPLVLHGTGAERIEVTVYDGRLGSGVDLILLDYPGLAHRASVYGEDGLDYPDNDRRFGTFSRAVVEIVAQRAAAGSPFDIVHAHDWPTAMVPYLMRERRSAIGPTRSVLTLHNVAHQGIFPKTALVHLGLDETHFAPDRLEFYGGINFLKGGVVAADAVTTVSPTYAGEILAPERGERLDGVFRSRREGITGIVNGIDYAVYNPTTDPAVAARYDADDASNKGRCKSAILKEAGLEIAPDRPLVVGVGRVVAQKGSDVLAASLGAILKNDVSVILAGSGDASLMRALEEAVALAPERAAYLGSVSEAVTHRIFAGGDIALIPSRYEPCGLVQLYSQRYGAVPVARRTGGLVDTIVDVDAALETGTGFLFDEATPADLVGGLQRALAAAGTPRWGALRRRIMRLDLGWDRPARRYVQIYRTLVEQPTA